MKKREIIIGAFIAFITTFSGVFLAFYLESVLEINKNIKFANGFISIQKDSCNTEYEALSTLKITNDPVELPNLASITILSGFIQLFIENIDLSIYKKLQHNGVELKKITQQYNAVKKHIAPQIIVVGKPPFMHEQQWIFEKKKFSMIAEARNINLEKLRDHLSAYKSEVKLVCENLSEFHVSK